MHIIILLDELTKWDKYKVEWWNVLECKIDITSRTT